MPSDPVKIETAGAYRIRSGEASRARIVPVPGPAPKPSRPMPYTARKLLRTWERTDRA